MILALVLFALFTLLAVGGAFWIGLAFRGPAAAVLAALATLALFAALFAFLALVIWPVA